MRIESKEIMDELMELRLDAKLFNDERFAEGFIKAVGLMEGIIAIKENKYRVYKCGNCKYLGEVTRKPNYRICGNPKKKFHTNTAHLKYPSTPACSLFEGKDD